ncbi:MAG: glycosyltransferase [Candidatus Moranbacteria bacterium]|nr:glycosyltransferase [Candidatus Moranbacteria bacterium]
MPKISVLMSIYNQEERFLIQSIESILAQTDADFEFIIIDDGSDKENAEVLESYTSQDSRIKLIKNSHNIGLTKSLNLGIKNAQGEYIARMDSDDIAFPNRLENQLNFLLNNGADIIGSACEIIDTRGRQLKKTATIPSFMTQNLPKTLLKGNFFTHSTLFGKRSVFGELYNESFKRAQDYEFLLRIISKKFKLSYQPQYVLKYRLGNKSISYQNSKEQEWFAIKARWLAITKYGYSIFYSIYILRALIVALIPHRLKRFLLHKI